MRLDCVELAEGGPAKITKAAMTPMGEKIKIDLKMGKRLK